MKIPRILFKNKLPQAGVYCIENIKNGKLYIGSSKNMYQRLHVHRIYLNNNTHQNQKLQNSWNKHTENEFICYCLELCSEWELTKREQYCINLFKPWYNITLMVERNILSEESRDKISQTLKRKYKSGEIKITRMSKVDCYDINGNFLKSYDQLNHCAEDLKIHVGSIIRVLEGKYKQCKGFQFKYSKDNKILSKIKVDFAGRAFRNLSQ